ncbi:MAG: glutamate decarboxylase [Bacillota bacterium]|jgi:hypothetical protein
MWAVIYIASGKRQIKSITELLQRESILCRIRYFGDANETNTHAEILVPESEAEEASSIINTNIFL